MTTPSTSEDLIRRAKRRALIALAVAALLVGAKIWLVQWLVLDGASVVALLVDLLFMFVLFAAIDLAFADLRLRAYFVVDAVVSALLIGLVIYHTYYGVLPSRQSLALAQQATTVGSSILTLLNPVYLVLFIDFPLVAFWVFRRRRRGIDPLTGYRPGALVTHGSRIPYVFQSRPVYFVALAASVLLGMSLRATAASPDAQDAISVAYKRGVASYVAVAFMKPVPGASSVAHAQGRAVTDLQRRANDLSGREVGEPRRGFTPGQAKGKNVIIIQIEALQSIAVGSSVAGMDVTPNLDRLAETSWFFPNCVSGAGVGTTADVEFVTNTSLYPPPEVGASLGWSDRQLTSMPRLLAGSGYDSYTFHTNEVGFWNRSQFYPAVGFTRYFDRTYFGTEDKMAFKSASDQVLLEKTLPRLVEAQQADKPFYAQIIMMSSHFPFENVPRDRRKLRLQAPYKDNIVGNYLTEANYVDTQIGWFVSQLKENGLWDESVVIIYGDHFGLPEPRDSGEAAALRDLAGHDYNDADKAFVPLIVHLPGQKQGVRITSPVGQIDVAPTIADALDVDLSGMLHFGRSVLRTSKGVIAASGLLGRGAYVDDSVLYVPGAEFARGQAFDVRTREEVDVSQASEETWNDVRELIALSREYVALLPLREDFNPDAEISFPRKR